jgi:hypothetical protein
MSGTPVRGQSWAPSRADYKLAFLIVGIPVAVVLILFTIFSLAPGSVDGGSLAASVAGAASNELDGSDPCDQLKGDVWRCRLDDTSSSSASGGSREFEVTVNGDCWEAVQVKEKGKRGEPFTGCVKLIDGL